MIKYTKKVRYIENGKPDKVYEIEKKSFYTLVEAIDYLNSANLQYYINDKAISAIESAEVLMIKNAYGNSPDIKKFNRTVNTQTGEIVDNMQKLPMDLDQKYIA